MKKMCNIHVATAHKTSSDWLIRACGCEVRTPSQRVFGGLGHIKLIQLTLYWKKTGFELHL